MHADPLWDFPGGIAKELLIEPSALPPLLIPPLPRRLIFPLVHRGGQRSRAVVEPGEFVLKGQVIALSTDYPPLHAASSGIVQPPETLPLPYPGSGMGHCLVIETDGQDTAMTRPPGQYDASDRDKILHAIESAGIVGLGGAGFPSATKLRTATDHGIHTLIVNGVECEPLASCDKTLLTHFPGDVLEGATLLCQAFRIRTCVLAIGADQRDVRTRLEERIRAGDYPLLSLVSVPPRYPAGGEKQLIQVITGREVPAQELPADRGLVCLNVSTVASIYRALNTGEPLISRLITVTGQGIRHPHNILARIGTPIAELIHQCGGYTPDATRLVMGGAMMGYPLSSDSLPVIKSTHCIWVAAQGEWATSRPEQPCIRCGACAEVCPAGLLPQEMHRYILAGDLERLSQQQLARCIECGCCDVVCPSHIPLLQQFQSGKNDLSLKQTEQARAAHAQARYEAKTARKQRDEQERIENAKRRKDNLGKDKDNEMQAALARLRAKRQRQDGP